MGNKYGDDFVISETFPGGHTAIVDAIIGSKQRFDFIRERYAQFAPSYDSYVRGPNARFFSIWQEIVSENNFSGSVLDLGCGTGLIGNLIKNKYSFGSELVGIDLCPEMAERALVYNQVIVGRMENVVMNLQENFDHIVAAGVFQFLEPNHFQLVLARSFDLAGSSVTFTIENIEPVYAKKLLILNSCSINFNHYQVMKEFVPPKGWNLVWKREDYLWTSPSTKEDISGLTVRFERDNSNFQGCLNNNGE